MDRGVPTEAMLQEMRNCDSPVQYLVGTPKGRLSPLEKALLAKPWQEGRPRGGRETPTAGRRAVHADAESRFGWRKSGRCGGRPGNIADFFDDLAEQTAKPTRHPAEEHQAVVQRCYEKRFHRASSAAPRA